MLGARPSGHPPDRADACDTLDQLDALPHMLALNRFWDRLIIEPTVAVADDLMPLLDKSPGDFPVALSGFSHRQQAHFNPIPAKEAQQTPATDA